MKPNDWNDRIAGRVIIGAIFIACTLLAVGAAFHAGRASVLNQRKEPCHDAVILSKESGAFCPDGTRMAEWFSNAPGVMHARCICEAPK